MDNFYEKFKDLLPIDFDERVETAFFNFDKNHNGTIEKKELIPFFKSVANFYDIDPKKLADNKNYQLLLADIDTNCDGVISMSEFKNFYAMVYLDKA
jgi:Ca2+-binding EF-hand superfamily protein